MTETEETRPFSFSKAGKFWLISCGVLFALSFPLGWIDNATQLTPDHSGVLTLGFSLAGAMAILGALILWKATKSWPLKNRIGFSVACSFFTFLASIVAFLPASKFAMGWLDFPQKNSRTFEALLPIGRAYRTYARIGGYSWTIQPTPLWSNIDISQADWKFMLERRRPWDKGTDPDNISSHGYFCAKVTMQQSGDALRVLYIGNYKLSNWTYKLPEGAIVVCPKEAAGQPFVELR